MLALFCKPGLTQAVKKITVLESESEMWVEGEFLSEFDMTEATFDDDELGGTSTPPSNSGRIGT